MLPLETRLSSGKLLPQSDLWRGVFLEEMSCRRYRAEGISQLQDWNMERKDLESKSQIEEFENGNAEE